MAFARGKKGSKTLWVVLMILLSLSLAAFTDYLYYRNRLYPGIRLRDMDVGGMSREEVYPILSRLNLTFTGPQGFLLATPLQDLGITVDLQKTFAGGYLLGRRGFWPWNYGSRLKLLCQHAYLPLHWRIDPQLLEEGVQILEDTFNSEPRDAFFEVTGDPGEVRLVGEREGLRMDGDGVKERILRNLMQLDEPLSIAIPVKKVLFPEITASLLGEKGIHGLMSSFSTTFNRENTNRTHNIELGASLVNNLFLSPGDLLSLNDLLDDSTEAKGYREAPVIIDGELVQGMGGGLCQVSTTLYNAALLANLDIIERRNHGLAVNYIEPGRDAAIAFPMKDLKIRNNGNNHILITSQVEGNRLYFRIFGQPLKENVEITTRILKTFQPEVRYQYDPDLPPGQEEVDEGIEGYVVEVWKTVTLEHEVISKEKLSLDRYPPYPTVIRRGPAPDG